jgi:hypothetical protein
MATARFRPAIVAGPKDDVQAVLKKLEATLSPDPRIRAEASLTARACVKPDD